MANSGWLVLAAMAFNLTRALGVLAGGRHRKAVTATIRTQLIGVAARITRSARQTTLRLPTNWPWANGCQKLATAAPRPEELTENTGPAGQPAMPPTRNSSLKINFSQPKINNQAGRRIRAKGRRML